MDYSSLNIFKMTQKKLDWLNKRQSIVANNLANANTPGYEAKDLQPLNFQSELAKVSSAPSGMTKTHAGHVGGSGASSSSVMVTNPKHFNATGNAAGSSNLTAIDAGVYETSIDGNGVVLEEQMAKMGRIQSEHELALTMFQKNVKMLKTAIGKN